MPVRKFARAAGQEQYNDAKLGQWAGLLSGDTAEPLAIPLYADKSVSVEGTLGPATVTIKGSLDGVNYYTLSDPQGNALTFTTATKRLEAILENVVYVMPEVSGADGTTNAIVNLLAR